MRALLASCINQSEEFDEMKAYVYQSKILLINTTRSLVADCMFYVDFSAACFIFTIVKGE